jgi:hypothetical protein
MAITYSSQLDIKTAGVLGLLAKGSVPISPSESAVPLDLPRSSDHCIGDATFALRMGGRLVNGGYHDEIALLPVHHATPPALCRRRRRTRPRRARHMQPALGPNAGRAPGHSPPPNGGTRNRPPDEQPTVAHPERVDLQSGHYRIVPDCSALAMSALVRVDSGDDHMLTPFARRPRQERPRTTRRFEASVSDQSSVESERDQ